VPQHRKPVHRPKILAAVLAVSLTAFGVAFAAEVEQEPARTAHEPLRVTNSPSPAASDVVITDERRVRPSRSADAREGLRKKDREKPEPKRTRSPEPTEEPEPPTEKATPTPTPEVKTPKPSPTREAPVAGSAIIDGTNAARADAGLPGLSVSSCLAGMAQQHADRLAAARSLHHQDLGGVMSSCGMSTAGENVAMNYNGPSAMVDQWLESPGHRANLLSNRFSLLGVGVAQASDGSWYGVQVFGDS